MSASNPTRNNHYVPQWYQEGFFEVGRNTLAYLNMKPPQRILDDGRVITERALFDAPTSRAFQQRDLYSTFFGTSVNDEIERRLFGDIDTWGSTAIRAFAGPDVGEWHQNFRNSVRVHRRAEDTHAEGARLAEGPVSCSHPKRLDDGDAGHPDDALYDLEGRRARDCFRRRRRCEIHHK